MSYSVVIDNGSGYIKAGFSNEDAPSSVFPTIVGTPKNRDILIGSEQKDYFFGTQAEEKRGLLVIQRPIENGIIVDWDLMEKLWDYTFGNYLRVRPDDQPVLLTEPILNPKWNREKTTQIMFETFGVPSLYLAMRPWLSMYATGHSTGLEIESGHSNTQAVSIYEEDASDCSAWIGGAKFASSTKFTELSISKDEYYEFGAEIVHQKCSENPSI
jgi:actin